MRAVVEDEIAGLIECPPVRAGAPLGWLAASTEQPECQRRKPRLEDRLSSPRREQFTYGPRRGDGGCQPDGARRPGGARRGLEVDPSTNRSAPDLKGAPRSVRQTISRHSFGESPPARPR